MTEEEYLKEIKELSNGKFGKDISVSGDAQIVLINLMKIHALTLNRIADLKSQLSSAVPPNSSKNSSSSNSSRNSNSSKHTNNVASPSDKHTINEGADSKEVKDE